MVHSPERPDPTVPAWTTGMGGPVPPPRRRLQLHAHESSEQTLDEAEAMLIIDDPIRAWQAEHPWNDEAANAWWRDLLAACHRFDLETVR